jgi:twinkle protein
MTTQADLDKFNAANRSDVNRRDLMPNIVTPLDLAPALTKLYRDGLKPGASSGWRSLDRLYTVAPGQLTVITGVPGHGKSEWLDALMVNLAARAEWRFAVYSPENYPQELHAAKLMEKRLGKPFREGPTERMTPAEMSEGVNWLEERFGFIKQSQEQPQTILEILEQCLTWCVYHSDKRGPRGIVIDPWNELEHQRPRDWSETEYISWALSTARRFARLQQCHVWIVAHPAKLQKDRETGRRPVPTPYDISGSAHWYNKADNCLTVWRDPNEDDGPVHVQKVRFKHVGKVGVAELRYNRVIGQYRDALKIAASTHDVKKRAAGDTEKYEEVELPR